MTGQHRNPRPSLPMRLRDCIAELAYRLEHMGDRQIRGVAGDITDRWDQPYPTGMTDQYDEIASRPIVLDHCHRLDKAGVCEDIRCEFDASHDPTTQTVIDVPWGEPEFRNAYGPVS